VTAGRRWLTAGLFTGPHLMAGEAIAWVAVMMPLFLAIIGLALDGGLVLASRRELLDVADSAARAGVAQVDLQQYRATAGKVVILDPPRAREAAEEVVRLSGVSPMSAIEVQPSRVRVEIGRDVQLGFLRVAGIRTARVKAAAAAEVRYGVEQGSH
jgi:hypothetical protein